MSQIFSSLPGRWPRSAWLKTLWHRAEQRWRDHPHGDRERWLQALQQLPAVTPAFDLNRAAPRLGATIPEPAALRDTLMNLHPWRKGPLRLGGIKIDTEWRSDWKWQRLSPHIDLAGQRVLDIGCGNGYFGLRMLGAGARLVVGIDPTLLFVMQHLACRHFSGDIPNYVLPLGVEDLPGGEAGFDTVFSMGVLYHRRDHAEHLRQLRALLRPGGALVLESLVLPAASGPEVLIPEGRYARMRNVWAIPATRRLLDWVEQAGFSDLEVVDQSRTTIAEQRSTAWMRFESLEQALASDQPGLTVEGHPAPLRAIVLARA